MTPAGPGPVGASVGAARHMFGRDARRVPPAGRQPGRIPCPLT